MVQVCHGH